MYNSFQPYKIVLAGNPNCGKSTLFNILTGARENVGNYSGVTVEKVERTSILNGREYTFVDLPGQYSMDAHSEDEAVARHFLTEHQTENLILVNVLDASNFERNLYLSLQLRELGFPTIIVLNMLDLAHQRGYTFRKDEIAKWLSAPVIECIGATGQGIEELLATITEMIQQRETDAGEACEIKSAVPKWLFELSATGKMPEVLTLAEQEASGVTMPSRAVKTEELVASSQEETRKATLYYEAISRLLPELVEFERSDDILRPSLLDRIFLHRFLGLPLFFGMLYLIFQLSFTLGEYPMMCLEWSVEALSSAISSFWAPDSRSLLKSLLVDGIIGGVGGVVVFLPNIVLLFLSISILEDSGYMARVAVLMDRFMSKIGLHGKSFIPMLVGFGCSVPAILATRILEDRRERLATMFVIPLMSCGARMPIYALLIPAFFPIAWQGTVLWGVYTLGIVLAILLAKVLSITVLKSEAIPFVLELPPWHIPTLKMVGLKTCERGWLYLKKAGTIILGLSIILWSLTTFPRLPETSTEGNALEYSYAGRIGKTIEPALKCMGMDWKIGTAFIGACAAKEVFVSQLSIIYRAGGEDDNTMPLRTIMADVYRPLTGVCILIFALVASPCMSTFAVVAQESGSWKWASAQWLCLTALGWVLCTAIFQIGTLCGL